MIGIWFGLGGFENNFRIILLKKNNKQPVLLLLQWYIGTM
jgi:hypothetical protein